MKFLNLLKKELRELINAQMITGLVLTVVLLMAVGKIMSSATDSALSSDSGEISISDQDKTDYTSQLIQHIKDSGYKVNIFEQNNTDKAELLNQINKDNLIIIPEGFTEEVTVKGNIGSIEIVSRMSSNSALSSLSDHSKDGVELIQNFTKNYIMSQKGFSEKEISVVDAPININEFTVVDDKWENISAETLKSLTTSQGMIIPIVVFILVMFTSQMIISAISTEKIDSGSETGSVSDILSALGLKIGLGEYALVGMQMFLTIMICLAVSLILGALVNDSKSAQTVLMPIMVLAMIPYLISLVYDVNMLSPIPRILVNAIQ